MNTESKQVRERLAQLVNAELDGELDSAGRTELEAMLERSSEARTLRSEWRALFNLLDSVPDEEPPIGIASRIVETAATSPVQRKTWKPGLFSIGRLAPAGAGFAVGLLLTVATYEIMAPAPEFGMPNAVGTAGIVQKNKTLDSVTLSDPRVQGALSLRTAPGGLILDVDIEGISDFTIDMEHPGFMLGGLEFDRRQQVLDPSAANILSGHLVVSGTGRQAFSAFLERADSPADDGVAVRVTTNGKIVYSGVLGG